MERGRGVALDEASGFAHREWGPGLELPDPFLGTIVKEGDCVTGLQAANPETMGGEFWGFGSGSSAFTEKRGRVARDPSLRFPLANLLQPAVDHVRS